MKAVGYTISGGLEDYSDWLLKIWKKILQVYYLILICLILLNFTTNEYIITTHETLVKDIRGWTWVGRKNKKEPIGRWRLGDDLKIIKEIPYRHSIYTEIF